MSEEQIIKGSINRVCERMVKASWLSQYGTSPQGFAVGWTEKGHDAAKDLRRLLDELGDPMSNMELLALSNIVDGMSRYPRPDTGE